MSLFETSNDVLDTFFVPLLERSLQSPMLSVVLWNALFSHLLDELVDW